MDTVAYLLERYPQAFVEAVATGAYCGVGDHWDSFPLLDVVGGRLTTAATIYATMQVFENMQAITEFAAVEQARHRWEKAAQAMAERHALAATGDVQEHERAQAERARRWERGRDQPWRKGHA